MIYCKETGCMLSPGSEKRKCLAANKRFPVRGASLWYLLLFSACLLNAEVLIPASNANINYYGRFNFKDPAEPAYGWSGAIIEANFSGSTIGVRITDGNTASYYDVKIDGALQTKLSYTSKTSRYILSTTLSSGSHKIRLILRNETHWNIKTFQGFYLADGNTLLAPPVKPIRKIEFLGDSWTAGYGNESNSHSCPNLDSVTNVNKAFPMLVTNAFHAQGIILGMSGFGLVHNLDSGPPDAQSMPYYYDSIFTFQDWHSGSGLWNFSQWIADVVVVFLGINDFSSGYPGDATYKAGYHALISRILGHYPNAYILCIQPHMTYSGSVGSDADIAAVVAAETATLGHPRVNTVGYPENVTLDACDWHPTTGDHKLIANTIIGKLMTMTGWDTTGSTATRYNDQPTALENFLLITTNYPGEFVITGSSQCAGAPIAILDIAGRTTASGRFNQAGVFRWNSSTAAPGIYLLGGHSVGWIKAAVPAR